MNKESNTFNDPIQMDWEQFGPGLYRKILAYNSDIMSVRVKFDRDGIAAMHSHPHSQTSCIISGKYEFTVDGITKTVEAGESVMIKPNQLHSCVCIEPGIVIDTFSPMREDFLK